MRYGVEEVRRREGEVLLVNSLRKGKHVPSPSPQCQYKTLSK